MNGRLIARLTALTLSAALLSACASKPPVVPPVPKAQGCEIIDPAKLSPPPAAGSKLKGLLPHRGPGANLPRTVPALLTTRGEPTAAQWQALPPTADAALVQAMEDAERPPVERARAISGLAIRGQEGAGKRIEALLVEPKTDAMVRRAAVRGLAAGYAEAAEASLIAALSDGDALLRETAAKALRPRIGRPAVRAAFEARQKVETEPLVKAALDDALKP